MTARERAELQSLVSGSTTMLRVGMFLFAVGAAGWLLRTLQRAVLAVSEGAAGAPFWLVPALAFAGFLYIRGSRWTGGREFRGRVRRDLARGEITLRRIQVVQALEAPEVEDEGPVFFLVEADGATMFFAGQEMARQKMRGFPWTEFEIAESPDSGHFFRLKPLGSSFHGVETRAPLEFSEAKELGVLSADYGVLDMSLDDLRNEA